MKKSEQIAINEKVLSAIDEYNASNDDVEDVGRLRTCSARVGRKGKWYILKSYSTIIAIIDTTNDTLYDFLRYVFGYTSTSAQHIAKFRSDYGAGKWGCEHEYRYYNV